MRPRGPRDRSLGKLDVAAPRSNIEPRFLSSVGYILPTLSGWLVGLLEVHSSQPVNLQSLRGQIKSGQLTDTPEGHPHVRRAASEHPLAQFPIVQRA